MKGQAMPPVALEEHWLTRQYWQRMQVVQRLSGDVPVFISAGEQPDDWEATAEEIDDRFVGDAQIW